MYARVLTSSVFGLSGELCWAEVDVEGGLPNFSIVGLGSQSVKEARDRIRSALENCGFDFPLRRITANLTPASRRKDGSHYDLPVAIGLLICSGLIRPGRDMEDLEDGRTAFLGELNLSGRVVAVDGVLPMVIGLKQRGVKHVILPEGNIKEAMLVHGIDLHPATSLRQVADHVAGFDLIPPCIRREEAACAESGVLDCSDIKGQEAVKRAAQIAAAGMHGMLMTGPPGVGKTMIGKRIPGLLPPLTADEKLEVTQIYSVAGLLKDELSCISSRPFRAPHHSISVSSLVGGGSIPRPGEISLAHRGVLFLDELPEFASGTLDALRQPMEDGYVVINRVNGRFAYPSRFMLVAAMNPCRCGFWGDPVRPCTCSDSERKRYIGKVSGPFLDRIDLQISVERVVYKDLAPGRSLRPTGTEALREGVERAAAMQAERYAGLDIRYNAALGPKMTELICVPERPAEKLLKDAFEKWDLSARSYHRILRLSRTIADIDGSESIKEDHVLEALQYRFSDGMPK